MKIELENNTYNKVYARDKEELQTILDTTRETFKKIYDKLGGLNNDKLNADEMCTIWEMVDLLENCKVVGEWEEV